MADEPNRRVVIEKGRNATAKDTINALFAVVMAALPISGILYLLFLVLRKYFSLW